MQGIIVATMNPDAIRSEVERLARAGKKIDAIKLVRERAGLGLKEAKEFVEALDRRVTEMHSTHSAHQTHAAHSPMPSLPAQPLCAKAEENAASTVQAF